MRIIDSFVARRLALLATLALGACGGSSSTTPDDLGTTTTPPDAVVVTPPDATVLPDLLPPPTPVGAQAELAILETTDLHQNIRSYDYYKLAEDKSVGIERTLTLINKARAEFKNTFLVDDGDTIQGTILGDYQATVSPLACSDTLAIYKVMSAIGYDVGGIGNHEFNYGLAYLNQVTGSSFNVDGVTPPASPCKGPSFPLVLANVYSAKSMAPLFSPYTIVKKSIKVVTPGGGTATATINVGVIAFTPPTIMAWDKRWLDGKVYTAGLMETAQKYVPEMKSKGADIVLAVSHGGLDSSPYSATMENGSFYLSTVPGVDALLLGHSHQIFPLATSTQPQFNMPGVDKVIGFVNGVPATMANFWGKHLGVIKFTVNWDGKTWSVDKTKTRVEARGTQNPDKSYVDADPSVAPLVDSEHQATIAYVKTPIGTTDFRMTTYFADVGEIDAIQIVNQAQADYVATYVQNNLPQYKDIPVLSISAPFKSGFGGGSDFTDVASGNMAINNAADLYLYPNTIYAVKITGAVLKGWLETTAGRFNQIDPAKVAPQQLVNQGFPGYNFDVFTDPNMSYEIDVTQPLKSRIKNLTYKGQPIADNMDLIVATNNYRASGGGNFPGIDGSKTIIASPDANRDVLVGYIKKVKNLSRAQNGAARSWRFTKVVTAGPVLFTSAQNRLDVATAAGITNVAVVMADDGTGKGTAVYSIDLSK